MLEATIAMALTGLTMLAVNQVLSYMGAAETRMTMTETRDEALEQIRSLGARKSTLEASRATNPRLNACMNGVNGVAAPGPLNCQVFTWYDVSLAATPTDILSGTPSAPKYLNRHGRVCAPTEAALDCPLSIWTRFRTQCKPVMTAVAASMAPPPTCPGSPPEIIEIRYRIGLRTDNPVLSRELARRYSVSELYGSILVPL